MRGPGSNPLRSTQNRLAVTKRTVDLDCCLFLAMACFTAEALETPTLQIIAHQSDKTAASSWIHDPQTDYSMGRYRWDAPTVSVEEHSLWCFSLERVAEIALNGDPHCAEDADGPEEDTADPPQTHSGKAVNPPWQQFQIQCSSVVAVYEFLPLTSSSSKSAKPGRSLPPMASKGDSRSDNEAFGFLQEVRRLYFEKGIRIPPSNRTVFVSSDFQFCAGPVQWRRKAEEESLYVAVVADRQQVCLLPALRKEQTQTLDKAVAGRPLRLLPLDYLPTPSTPFTPFTPCDSVDLRPDSQLLHEQTAAWNAEVLSKDSWPKIDVELSQSEWARKFYRYRLQEILSAWQSKQTQNDDLESFLLQTPTAKALLKQATATAVAEQRAALEVALADLQAQHDVAVRQMGVAAQKREAQEVDFAQRKAAEEAALAEAQSQFLETTSRLETAQGELCELQRLTGDARLIAEEKAEAVEAHLLDRIGHLKSHAAEELAALLPIRQALGLDQIVVQVTLPPTVAPALPPVEPFSFAGNPPAARRSLTLRPPLDATPLGARSSFDDLADMRTRLKRGLRDRGGAAWESLCAPVLAALMAGLLPVVALEDSHAFWATVAESIAAGRRLSIYGVSGSREPLDLFGRLEENTFYPHAHRLADQLLSAGSTDDLSLVTLENVEALDWDGVLSPLLCARAEQCPFPLLHPHAAEASGAYAGLTAFSWSPSFLLTGTWSPSSFPPPPSFFRQAILLLPEGSPEEIAKGSSKAISWTGAEWQRAVTSTRSVESSDVEAARVEIATYSTIPASTAVRFFRALRALVANDEARRLMRQHAILPPLVAQGSAPEAMEGTSRATVTALQRLCFGHGAL